MEKELSTEAGVWKKKHKLPVALEINRFLKAEAFVEKKQSPLWWMYEAFILYWQRETERKTHLQTSSEKKIVEWGRTQKALKYREFGPSGMSY